MFQVTWNFKIETVGQFFFILLKNLNGGDRKNSTVCSNEKIP